MAFHPYTQVIPQVFNPGGFGPPRGLTRASPCPCVDHPASGLQHATQTPYSDSVSLRLPHTGYPRHAPQLAGSFFKRHAVTPRKELPRLVGTRFQALFHDPSPGCFSSFPHGTSPLSVTREYLGLPRGRGRFTRDFTGPVLLGNTSKRRRSFAYGTVTRYGRPFQTIRLPRHFVTLRRPGRDDKMVPQPPARNARRLSHAQGLA